jgi:hypothetical protein
VRQERIEKKYDIKDGTKEGVEKEGRIEGESKRNRSLVETGYLFLRLDWFYCLFSIKKHMYKYMVTLFTLFTLQAIGFREHSFRFPRQHYF